MKVVKCVCDISGIRSRRMGLTYGKIYEVIHHGKLSRHDWILIENDNGEQQRYYIEDDSGIWFVDATPYIREEKLKELGIF
jgi:hypothetical protein